MHYYKRDIGKYYKKAGRLTMLQHGAYTMLMDACYDREVFPTVEQAIDWCWASTNEEIEAVNFVLSKFFTKHNNVFKQSQITETLEKYHSNAATNKAIAVKREADRRTKREQTVNEPPPNQELLITNQELRTKDQTPLSEPAVPTCKHKEVIQIYQNVLPELPRIVEARYKGSKKETNLRSRWKEDPAHQDLDFWQTFFSIVRTNPHWMGENDRGWKADFEWLLKRDNFDKVIQRGMA